MKRVALVVAVVALVALVLAACGGGASQPSGGGQSTAAPTSPPAQSGGGQVIAAGDPAKGEQLYQSTCSACHGPDARGLPNLGKDLRESEFVKSLSDQELLEFIKKGRPASDPANTTGVDMPPKGGNPALTDQEIMDIIAYIRSIQE